jgi:hypothetical protein
MFRSLKLYCTFLPLVFHTIYPSAEVDIDTKLKFDYFNLVICDECAHYSCKLGTDLTFLFDCKSRIDLLHAYIFPFSAPKNNNECDKSYSNDVILVRFKILNKFKINSPSIFLRL